MGNHLSLDLRALASVRVGRLLLHHGHRPGPAGGEGAGGQGEGGQGGMGKGGGGAG